MKTFKIVFVLAFVVVLVVLVLYGTIAWAAVFPKDGSVKPGEGVPIEWTPPEPVVRAEPSPRSVVHAAVVQLQPWFRRNERDGRRVASIIHDAAIMHGIDPRLAVALAMRESSLRPGVVTGALGEQGMFQVMTHGYARRVCPRTCDLGQPRCNADVALCYLAHVREHCASSDAWVWIGAYGTDHCPSAAEARAMPSTRRARRYLVEIAGEEQASVIWPEG